jgi:uncharacterized protein (DUF952 family)
MALVYHLARRSEWEMAGATGPYRAASLAQEGFIHCSGDEEQMLRVANHLFACMEDVLVLDVDTGRLTSPVKREPSRSGEIYPHIYGPINVDAVVGVRPLIADAAGKFYLAGSCRRQRICNH